MTPEEAQMYVNSTMQRLQQAKMASQYGANKKAGEEFLAANKAKAGVTTTASGLQYEVIKKGTGAMPSNTAQVKVHYHGTLIDGTVFDSSVNRGEPATFGVNQVIKGWTEALQLMPVGSKYKLYIPQELAYGQAEQGNIKPYSALIFEVELIAIEK
jgi:FKBP-type peptidyl-prolyl cis-trans isomerase FklB